MTPQGVPLGAGRPAGSTLPLDRFLTSRELGLPPSKTALIHGPGLRGLPFFCRYVRRSLKRTCRDLIVRTRPPSLAGCPPTPSPGSMMPQKNGRP